MSLKATGKNSLIKVGKNSDVVKYVVSYYEKWREQPTELVKDIKFLSVNEQCYSIFYYLLSHVCYEIDRVGYQFIKSPARLLKDHSGDCKSMTIFIASCLHCLRIPHIIRFVNFDGGSQYTHVYVIAIDEWGSEIVLDAVERDKEDNPVYNYARPFAKKYDITYNY